MCRRSERDPLVRLITDRYRLNVLRVPRAGFDVGDLLVEDSGDLRRMGALAAFFDPPLHMPKSKVESLAPLDSERSSAISWGSAAKPMAAFLAALGLSGVADASAALEYARDMRVSFRISGATLESLDAVDLGNELAGRLPRTSNALYRADRRFFVTQAVARATGLELSFHSKTDAGAKLAVGIANAAKGSAKVKVRKGSAAGIHVTGTEPLVFGVSILRLTETEEAGVLRLDLPAKLHPVRGQEKARSTPGADWQQGIMVGGDDGELLINIGDNGQ